MHQTPSSWDKVLLTLVFVWRLIMNINALEYMIVNFRARGLKGTAKREFGCRNNSVFLFF